MEELLEKAVVDSQWKGYGWDELRFRGLVARTKLEIAKATAAGKYQELVSTENTSGQLLGRLGSYVQYATVAFQVYKLGKRIWQQFKSKKK